MNYLFYQLGATGKHIVTKSNILLLLLSFALTYICVASGFDAYYFVYFQNTTIYTLFSLAGFVGFIMPMVLWLLLLGTGMVEKRRDIVISAWMWVQASFLGWFFSSLLKVFTGRIPPPHGADLLQITLDTVMDLSHGFRFGVLEGGIFWGWPSSHTATAFAGAMALAVYYRDYVWVRYIAIIYASYIAIGASMSFHWLGDAVAGVFVGSIIGLAVGRSFRKA
jgi:membrane-associated phospholipid phosphatase